MCSLSACLHQPGNQDHTSDVESSRSPSEVQQHGRLLITAEPGQCQGLVPWHRLALEVLRPRHWLAGAVAVLRRRICGR